MVRTPCLVCAAARSTWFADVAWAALGLPDAWLHTLYQAVLAPVRCLWHAWGPNSYKAHYALIEQQFGLAEQGPGLGALLAIMGTSTARFLQDEAGQLLPSLVLSAAVMAGVIKAASSAQGGKAAHRI